jgi:hypothetical protein
VVSIYNHIISIQPLVMRYHHRRVDVSILVHYKQEPEDGIWSRHGPWTWERKTHGQPFHDRRYMN